jgi:hypothetical protein
MTGPQAATPPSIQRTASRTAGLRQASLAVHDRADRSVCPWRGRQPVRHAAGVTSAVPADARLAPNEFRSVRTRDEAPGPRDPIDFRLSGLRQNEDEHAEGPQKPADEEPAAGYAG